MYHTYIIYSKLIDQYYTGHTSVGVKKRVLRHNRGDNPSTKSGIPWEVKYIKSLDTKTKAIKWENFIKRPKSRVFIEKLIASEENECRYELSGRVFPPIQDEHLSISIGIYSGLQFH